MPPGKAPVLLASPPSLAPSFFQPKTYANSRRTYNGSIASGTETGGSTKYANTCSTTSGTSKSDNTDASPVQSRWPVARVLVLFIR